MYKLCKTEQSATRQKMLELGLLNCMLTRHYEEISVSDLCTAMDIPRKSFYRYFSGKDGALHALIDHTLMGYEGFSVSQRAQKTRTLTGELENFFLFWIEQKALLDALQKSSLSGVLIERAIMHSLSETVLPKRFLKMDSAQLQRDVTTFGVCGLMSMVLIWHHDGYPRSAAEMAGAAARLLGKPLFPNVEELL